VGNQQKETKGTKDNQAASGSALRFLCYLLLKRRAESEFGAPEKSLRGLLLLFTFRGAFDGPRLRRGSFPDRIEG
jgi:hypothetical protein